MNTTPDQLPPPTAPTPRCFRCGGSAHFGAKIASQETPPRKLAICGTCAEANADDLRDLLGEISTPGLRQVSAALFEAVMFRLCDGAICLEDGQAPGALGFVAVPELADHWRDPRGDFWCLARRLTCADLEFVSNALSWPHYSASRLPSQTFTLTDPCTFLVGSKFHISQVPSETFNHEVFDCGGDANGRFYTVVDNDYTVLWSGRVSPRHSLVLRGGQVAAVLEVLDTDTRIKAY